MDLHLQDSVVVVTAAGSGIGLGIVEAFLAEGATVVAGDLNVANLPEHASLTSHELDLLDSDGPARLIEEAASAHGRIDVLVNVMGGLDPKLDGFTAVPDGVWQRTFDLNLFANVRAVRAVIPHMQRTGHGSIVSIASDAARQADPRFVDYCAAKAALVSFSKSVSIEYGPEAIRSNIVSPGPTRTPQLTGFFVEVARERGVGLEDVLAEFVAERRMPLGRLGETSDVAPVVLFLSSTVARHVTGSDYRVDGGVVQAQ